MIALPRLVGVIAGAAGMFLIGGAFTPLPSRLLAQQQAPTSGTAVVAGVAIDGTTKTPVPGAAMSLSRDPSDGTRMPVREILADAQGRFVFTAVPEGRFRLEARGNSGSYGAYGFERSRPKLESSTGVGLQVPSVPFNLDVRPGQRVTASVSIWRDPVISGRVVSDRGEAIRDALVEVVRWNVFGGRRRLSGTLTTTDDQGTFSARVSPGDYLLMVTAQEAVVVRRVTDTAPGEQYGYARTFYPSAPTPDGATTISVEQGDVRNGLVIQLPLVRTYRVRGTLRSQGATMPTRISIRSAGSQSDDQTSSRATSVDRDGRFLFNDMSPGRYVLATLTSGVVTPGRGGAAPVNTTWVNASIDVDATDVDVVADVHQSLHIAGRVVFDGSGPPPDFLSSDVTLERDAQAGEPTDFIVVKPRSVDSTGRFSIDVLPGRFVVRGSAGGRGTASAWTIRSAMSGSQDLADVPFTPFRDMSDIVVTFTDRAAGIQGRVVNSDREAALVVVFPADEKFWTDFIVRRKRTVRPTADGTFNAPNLPAGDYYVCAVRGLTETDVRSGAYFSTLAPLATRVNLAEGDMHSVELRAVSASAPRTTAPPPLAVESADAAEVRRASAVATRGGSISGRVIDATTGRPIAQMRLSLAANLEESVYSDDEGDFLFDSVAPGPHLIYTRHHSYVPTIYGARRPDEPGTPVTVAAGQRVTGLTFPITRGAILTGTVVDHNGEPLPDTNVTVRQYRWQPTGRELVTVRTVSFLGPPRTDLQGRFRLVGLAPGDYIVTADRQTVSRRPVTITTPADVAFATARPDVRQRVPEAATGVMTAAIYPSSFDVARGNTLRLRVGEERDITLHLSLVNGGSVSGSVHGPDGAPMASVSVQLVSNDPLAGTTSLYGTSDASGAFRIAGVSPGAYTLRSTSQRPALAALPLDVQVEGDVAGLVLTMGPMRALTGRIRTDSSDAPPQANNVRLMAARIGAPAGTANATATASWGADGSFTFNDLAPGRYRLTFTAPQNTVRPRWIAQIADGTNVLDRGVDIGANTTTTRAELVVSTTASEFSGMVESKSGKTDGVFVVLFATQPEAWTPPSLRLFATQPDQTGRFTFSNVPPGTYRIVPVADAEPNQWFDPAFLATLVDRATPVRISVQSSETIRLTLP